MALPAIAPYPMPSPAAVPPSRAAWQLQPARSALLIHDMQRYFLAPFRAGMAPLDALIANIARIRERVDAMGIPVFFTTQPGDQSPEERGLLRDVWGAGPTAALIDVVAELAPAPHDTVLVKRRYSAFYESALASELLRRQRDQLVICGVYAHIGCLVTAVDGFMQGVQPFLVGDAVADFSAADHATALGYVAGCCGVVRTTDQIVAALG